MNWCLERCQLLQHWCVRRVTCLQHDKPQHTHWGIINNISIISYSKIRHAPRKQDQMFPNIATKLCNIMSLQPNITNTTAICRPSTTSWQSAAGLPTFKHSAVYIKASSQGINSVLLSTAAGQMVLFSSRPRYGLHHSVSVNSHFSQVWHSNMYRYVSCEAEQDQLSAQWWRNNETIACVVLINKCCDIFSFLLCLNYWIAYVHKPNKIIESNCTNILILFILNTFLLIFYYNLRRSTHINCLQDIALF